MLCSSIPFTPSRQESSCQGLENQSSNLDRLSDAKTLSMSPENPRGEKDRGGMATERTGARAVRDLGRVRKISPSVDIAAAEWS